MNSISEDIISHLEEVENRSKQIQQIATDIVILNELVKDVSTLVQGQGTLIDNIEANITITNDNVKEAITELKQANKSHKGCLIC